MSGQALRGAALSALAALFVLAAAASGPAAKVTAALLGVVVMVAVARRPVPWLGAMLVVVALQQVVLAFALAHGAPLAAVKGAGALKEAVVVGLLLRVVTDPVRERRRPDAPDVFAALLLLVIAVYFVAPIVGMTSLGGLDSSSRLLAARQNGLFVLLFLACRRLRLTRGQQERVQRVVLALGVVLAAGGLVEVLRSDLWDRLTLNLSNVPLYRYLVFGVASNGGSLTDRTTIGGVEVVRAGSFLLSALALGFWLVVPFALGLSGAVSRRNSRILVAASCGVGILLTETRSAILAALLAGGYLAVTRTTNPVVRRRLRVSVVVLVLLAVPFASTTTLSTRISGQNGQGADVGTHLSALQHGFSFLVSHPLGTGLGTGVGVGQRVGADTTVTAENTYLGFGNELGVGGFVAFTGLFLMTVRRLVQRSRRTGEPLATGMAAASVGLAVGAMFLHVFVDIPTALVFWSMAGLALPVREPTAPPETAPVEPAELVAAA